MDLDSIRFSLPTICDAVPRELPRRPWRAKPHRMYLDDWRQIELVAKELEPIVRSEIVEIQAVVDEADGNMGFERVHVRAEPTAPLARASITKRELETALSGVSMPLGFVEQEGVMAGGIAIQTRDRLSALCQEIDGQLVSIGIDRRTAVSQRDATALTELLTANGLLLVHWCRRHYTSGPADQVLRLLR